MAVLRIAFLGDSMTNGTGDPTMLGWVGRVCAAAWGRGHDVTAYNLGIRGDTSADIHARWRAEAAARLPAGRPRALVFSFGVNDCVLEGEAPRVHPDATLKHAQAMLAAAQAIGPVLMVGPPPIDDAGVNARVRALEPRLAGVCAELGVPFLPVLEALLADPHWIAEARAGDGAHPGAKGYAAMAALVDQWPAWRAWLA
jgi:lysophospholipase L1-like esterase